MTKIIPLLFFVFLAQDLHYNETLITISVRMEYQVCALNIIKFKCTS